MKKVFAITLALMFAISGIAFASVQLYQDGAEQGHINQFNCSTGMVCTKVGDRVNAVATVGTAADIRSGTVYGITTLVFNGAASALNTWKGVANGIEFEGATANTEEVTLDVADPTADVTYRLPVVAAGTYGLMSSTLATNAVDIANSVTGGTATLIFEGATADAHEATVTPTDPTADVVWTLPTGPASTVSFMASSLATNFAEAANSVTGGTNTLIIEGSADAYETILTATDATSADKTITLPNLTGTALVANATYAPTAALRFAAGTILSGQTAIAVAMTGNTAGNLCMASAQESPSNACYIKNVVAGTDNVTVTVNTDPGASNLDLAVMCWN